MGYNAQLAQAGVIPAMSAAAGTAIHFTMIPAPDKRVTIPYLRLRTGEAGGVLGILQTSERHNFSQETAGVTLEVPGISEDNDGKTVVLRFESGDTMITTVVSQDEEVLTLADSVQQTEKGTLYILGTESEPGSGRITLAVSGSTELKADCPGVVTGKELGWPVQLHLANTDGDQEIEGGTIALIGV